MESAFLANLVLKAGLRGVEILPDQIAPFLGIEL
jgi:hypothetical protein